MIKKRIPGLLFALLSLLNILQGQNHSSPNFIIILADDLGYGDLGYTGSTQINTPNIDFLAKQGVIFEQGYVSSPVCSPSRAGLLTGRNQVTFGHDNNIDHTQPGFDPHFLGLPLSEKTIADRLGELGYVNGLIGKWHLGEEPHFHPTQRGFDEFWGFTGGGHDYFQIIEGDMGYKRPIEANYPAKTKVSYLTDDIGSECVGFIERHKARPFFLFASFNAPHTPLQAPEKDMAVYELIKDEKRRTYAAMVHRLDVNVGRIINALKETNLLENTVVVFLSDNGGPVYNNGSLNSPCYGQKGTLYEGGIRVPFLIHWPQKLPGGISYPYPVSALDLMPTFLAIAGMSLGTMDFDGVNLIPYILEDKKERPHQELKWRFTIGAAIRTDDYKLIRLPDRLPMLFNLSEDISEQKDLALQRMEITRSLLKKLGEWDVNLPHPLFLEGAEWKVQNLKRYDMEYQLFQPKNTE